MDFASALRSYAVWSIGILTMRPVLAVSTLVLSFTSAWATERPAVTIRADSKIDIVYLTAPDCVYCRSWRYTRTGDWGRFSETPAGKSATLITVSKQTLRSPIQRADYPDKLQGLYDLAPQFGNIVPAWWLLVDGHPVARRVGENTWRRDFEPLIERLYSSRAAGGGVLGNLVKSPPAPARIPQAVGDIEGVPYLSETGRDAYRRFLERESPRAFALSSDGSYAWRSGSSDAAKAAMDQCNARATDFPCKVYAHDDRVVYRLD